MGQEIVHCAGCGLRLRSVDFERGEAQRRDDHTYCRPCALEAGIRPEPPVASKPSKNTTRHIPVVLPPSTTRIPIATPRRPLESVPRASVSPALVWGGVALGAAVLLLGALMLGSGSRGPALQDPPNSRSGAVSSAPSATPGPRGRSPETTPQPSAPSSESDDWRVLERRVAESVGRERFREALDLLETERKRHDSLEWTAAVQRASLGVDASAKKLCQDLQAKMAAARARGADAELRALADRIAGWGLPAVSADSEPGVAVPPPALVAAPNPEPAAPELQPDASPPSAPAPAVPLEKAAPAAFTPGPLNWELLAPLRATASQGTRLSIQEDGSILAEGGTPARERYAVVVQTTLGGIAALRLEVLTDRSLPASGPGRAHNGNFVLTELQVQVLADAKAATGTPIPIERAAAEHSQEGFPIAHVFDGRNDTGWAILPEVGRSLEAIFELRTPLPSNSPLTLLVILDHQSTHQQHQIGRFRLSASVAKGASSDIALRPAPPVDQGTVDAAIRRGLGWLRTSGSPGSDVAGGKKPRIPNCDDLLLLTFLHAGMPENDPRFQQLLAAVLAAPYSHTYSVAIRAMALEELDRVRYQPQIVRCAQFLLDNQTASGQWSYGEPSVAVESIRADLPAATVAAVRPTASTTPRPKPKVVQKISVRPTRTPGGNGDFSNSQYAALGLRACLDAGIVVPKEVLLRGSQAFTLAQLQPAASKELTPTLPSGRKPRGWCYDSPCACPLHRPYGTMSSGAVSALAIYDHLLGRDAKKDPAILDGLAWLQVNYAIDTVPGPIEWDKISKNTYVPYYLYALERAMILTGNEQLGTHAWYADGARYLLRTQKSNGSWAVDDWGRDTWDTCFALLFLKRSTRPLVASTDRTRPVDEEKK